jgi:hypothetical protein
VRAAVLGLADVVRGNTTAVRDWPTSRIKDSTIFTWLCFGDAIQSHVMTLL